MNGEGDMADEQQLQVESYIAGLSAEGFRDLVARTRDPIAEPWSEMDHTARHHALKRSMNSKADQLWNLTREHDGSTQ